MGERVVYLGGKSPIINADLFLETSQEERYITCLSPRDVFIIRSYLFPFVKWRTRIARPIYGSYWEVATEDEYLLLQEAIQSLDGKITEVNMTCIDDGLTKVADALTLMAQNMCCGSGPSNGGVVGTVDGEGGTIPIYGTGPLLQVENGVPPEGWDTWEEYLTNKCQVANAVFDGMITALGNLSVITFVNMTALATLIGLAIPGILAFPPVAIPVMIGLLVALAGSYTYLGDLKDELQENKASIVCNLYATDTVETMVSIISDALDTAIAAIGVSSFVGYIIKQVALLLVNGDALNQLQSGIAGYSYPDATCDCPEDFTFRQQTAYGQGYGFWTPTNYGYNSEHTINSYGMETGLGGETFDYVTMEFGQLVDISIDIINFSPPGTGWTGNYFRAGSSYGDNYAGESDVYNSNTETTSLSGVGNITFASAHGTGFQVGLTITEHVP